MTERADIKSDHAIADEAAKWVIKFNAGKLSRDDAFAFEDWINESEAHRRAFRALGRVWLDIGDLEEKPAPRRMSVLSLPRIVGAWAQIKPARAAGAFVAASFGAAFLGFAAILSFQHFNSSASLDAVTAQTLVGELETVALSDGTKVQLNTDSELEVRYTADARVVMLGKGEAHFDVEPDPERPFRVYAGGNVIEAVGTAFNVYLKDGATEVIVTEGRVELGNLIAAADGPGAHKEEFQGIATLDAGRYARLGDDQLLVEEIPKTEIEKQLSWTRGMLMFDGETLENVLIEFGRYTETEFVIETEGIQDMRIVGYFFAGDTDKFVNTLQGAFDIQSERRADDVIYLYGKEDSLE